MLKILTYGNHTRMSAAETALWDDVLEAGEILGHAFVKKGILFGHPVGAHSPELRLVIELENTRALNREVQVRSTQQEFELRTKGYTVLRFSDEEILNDVQKVRSMIKEWIIFHAA